MTDLEQELHRRIERDGPMPFAAYMQVCLYHPTRGYYASGARRTGRGGDFMTSPELDPAFGALWARGLHEIWEALGRPAPFHVVEIGPGEGAFAASLLRSAVGGFGDALNLHLVERVPDVEERQRARLDGAGPVRWHRSVVDLPQMDRCVVIANEVLDNLPVHVVEMTEKGLREVCVTTEEGRLSEVLLEPPAELARFAGELPVELPVGHRRELHLAARSLIRRVGRRIGAGALVFVDYGGEGDDLVRHPGGTLACFSTTGRDELPLERPGEKDITVDADWTQIRLALRSAGFDTVGPHPQRDVLLALGARELDEVLVRSHDAALAEGSGGEAVRAHSRRQALRALLDAGGMGGFGVMCAARDMQPPRFMREAAGP